MAQHWYTISNIDRLDTPALVIYPERVQHNIELLKSSIDNTDRLRVHAKTHKSPEATRLLLANGIHKFKCATIAEAEMLAMCGVPDVLLAYQPAGPKIERYIRLIQQFPDTLFACLVDNDLSAKCLANAAAEANLVMRVYIDLNVGMNRTGIAANSEALQLYLFCAQLPSLHIIGLHAYDGHIHDSDYEVRQQRSNEAFAPVAQLTEAIIEHGLPKPIIIAGGSPTFPIHAQRGEVECSPGTFIYWDWGYDQHYAEQAFLPAALVVTRVVSLPAPGLICLDAGHKSIASESGLAQRIHFLNAPDLTVVGHSEEHLIVGTNGPHHFKVGQVLYGVPYHVCPTVALYERAAIVEQNQLAGEWKNIARDRKITL